MSNAAAVSGIYRYPVKGLSPEALDHVTLRMNDTLPADRRYAIENGPSGFDSDDPKYFPKNRFLMLMRNEGLARLRTGLEDTTNTLTIQCDGFDAVRGNLETPEGRTAIEQFLAERFASELRGPPKILTAPGHSFSDVSAKVVSIINVATLAAIEKVIGQPVNPLRFRANLYVSGWPAWHEFDLMNGTLRIGSSHLRIVKRIVRCAAVNVDPVTAERDMNIPAALTQAFGHADCGVYARVTEGGVVRSGDEVELAEPQLI